MYHYIIIIITIIKMKMKRTVAGAGVYGTWF